MGKTLKPRSHDVKKNETIQTIAKKYGFKSWKEVWKHPGNDSLRKVKKDGKGLGPGDTVIVPALNEKEREERREKVRTLGFQVGQGEYLAAQLAETAKVYEEEARRFNQKAKTMGAEYDLLTKEIKAAASSIKKKAIGADIVGKLALLGVSASSFWKEGGKSLKGLKSFGKAKLGKLNNPTVKKIVAGGATTLGIDGAKNLLEAIGVLEKDHVDEIEILTKELGRLYYNVTAPSFYGKAVTTLINGGTWSEAMTADVQRDLKLAIAKIEKDKKAAIAMVIAAEGRMRGRAVKAKADSAKVLKGIQKIKKEFASL